MINNFYDFAQPPNEDKYGTLIFPFNPFNWRMLTKSKLNK